MWAIFSAPFNYDRRPKQALAFSVKPGTHNLPHDVVEVAIKAGKATKIKPPRRGNKHIKLPAA